MASTGDRECSPTVVSDFTLIVSDDASDDDTPDVVASFGDHRIAYHRLEHNVGRVANTNGLIALTSSEFLVLLGDDDELRPRHLKETVSALRRWPSAGVAHTGCVVIDQSGHVLNPHIRFLKTKARVHFEPAKVARERCMKTGWGACFCSIMFRTDAITRAGGLREADGVIDDLPLLLRIAEDWDFVYVNEPLACVRAHVGASSSVLGEFGPSGYRSSPRPRRDDSFAEVGVPCRNRPAGLRAAAIAQTCRHLLSS